MYKIKKKNFETSSTMKLVNKVKPGGSGKSNEGNTARRFSKNY